MVGAGNQSPKLRGLFSSFTANDPQLQRRRSTASARWRSGCRSSEITSAMQIFLGSQYVNDFEFNNRAYRVYVQADQHVPRRARRRCKQLYVRDATRADDAARAAW